MQKQIDPLDIQLEKHVAKLDEKYQQFIASKHSRNKDILREKVSHTKQLPDGLYIMRDDHSAKLVSTQRLIEQDAEGKLTIPNKPLLKFHADHQTEFTHKKTDLVKEKVDGEELTKLDVQVTAVKLSQPFKKIMIDMDSRNFCKDLLVLLARVENNPDPKHLKEAITRLTDDQHYPLALEDPETKKLVKQLMEQAKKNHPEEPKSKSTLKSLFKPH